MAMSIGKFITGAVAIVVITSFLAVLLNTYGNPSTASSLGIISNQSLNQFNSNVFNPLNTTVRHNFTIDPTSVLISSAFVFPALFVVLGAVINVPNVLQLFFLDTLAIFPVQLPIGVMLMSRFVFGLTEIFIIIQFVSSWQKYNLW